MTEISYLYLEQVNMTVYSINPRAFPTPCRLDNVEEDNGSFWFQGKKYDSLSAFVDYLRNHNFAEYDKYTASYGITPSFIIYQTCKFPDVVETTIVTHGKFFLFTCDEPIGSHILNKKNVIFNSSGLLYDTHFDVCSLQRLIYSIMVNRVIWPTTKKDRYLVRFGRDGLIADLEAYGNAYYLHIQDGTHTLNKLLEFYKIPESKYKSILSPEVNFDRGPILDNKENIYKLLNFINNTCYSTITNVYDRIEIVQSKFGKWFAKSKSEKLSDVFGDMEKVREVAREFLGGKKITGVFPECNSKEELIALIQKLNNG